MKYYIGLDVSMKTTSICIIDQHGSIVFEENVATDPATINAAIKSTKVDIEKVAIESGSISHWLVQELRNKGLSIICIDSRKCRKCFLSTLIKRTKMTLG